MKGMPIAAALGKAACLETDDIGYIHRIDYPAGGKNLHVMGRGMSGEFEVTPFLADDLVYRLEGDSDGTETAYDDIVSVVNMVLNRFFHGCQLDRHLF